MASDSGPIQFNMMNSSLSSIMTLSSSVDGKMNTLEVSIDKLMSNKTLGDGANYIYFEAKDGNEVINF
jgi:hypothetical protein